MQSPSRDRRKQLLSLRLVAGREDDLARDRDRVEMRARHQEASHLLVDRIEVEEASATTAVAPGGSVMPSQPSSAISRQRSGE